ncbi:hypothetical protein QN277_000797 [Acacia crassicarpa]|uniref:Profilin n=1 Tax=Acacia crassicarpa TaxID=499986 RepID=A0AAE1THK9_9FABA|nr:hypothetical protein QN277_000797 [Acacia crassicarpa]
MSWQTYLDEHLMYQVEGKHLNSAAIVGQDGSVWAQSATFPQLKPEEITAIMNDFAEPGSLAPNGLYLGGTKYMVIEGEPGLLIRGMKVYDNFCGFHYRHLLSLFLHCSLGAGGVTIKKTTQALVIGIYEEPMAPGHCDKIVKRVGADLIDHGL